MHFLAVPLVGWLLASRVLDQARDRCEIRPDYSRTGCFWEACSARKPSQAVPRDPRWHSGLDGQTSSDLGGDFGSETYSKARVMARKPRRAGGRERIGRLHQIIPPILPLLEALYAETVRT